MQLYGFWRSLATFRVRIALNLKGLSAAESSVNLLGGEQHQAAFRAVNPQGVVPALIDGDGPPLYQSLAILEYLEETHPAPPLLPTGAKDRARVRGLADIVACDAHPLVVPRVRAYLTDRLGIDEPTRLAWIHHWITEAFEAIEPQLADPRTGRFCHGDAPTIADICLVSHAVGATLFELDWSRYERARRIVEACLALDAFAKAHPLRQPGAPQKH